jgi:hypothetical protein
MQRFCLLLLALLGLAACGPQALQPARGTAEAVLDQVGPTVGSAIDQVAPTVRALIPTPAPTTTPDPSYPSTLTAPIIACFEPGCAAEAALIVPAGTRYNDTGPDSGTWRFIQIEGGGQVWVVQARLTHE